MGLQFERPAVGVHHGVALAPFDPLASVIAADAPALGRLDALAVDDGGCRACLAASTLTVKHHEMMVDPLPGAVVAEPRKPAISRRPWRKVFGGKPFCSRLQTTPPRSMWKIALTTSRISHLRWRPHLDGGGRNGARISHSASVTSLPWRRPTRLCCARVVGIHRRAPARPRTPTWNHICPGRPSHIGGRPPWFRNGLLRSGCKHRNTGDKRRHPEMAIAYQVL